MLARAWGRGMGAMAARPLPVQDMMAHRRQRVRRAVRVRVRVAFAHERARPQGDTPSHTDRGPLSGLCYISAQASRWLHVDSGSTWAIQRLSLAFRLACLEGGTDVRMLRARLPRRIPRIQDDAHLDPRRNRWARWIEWEGWLVRVWVGDGKDRIDGEGTSSGTERGL